jgi:hypothetical protein
MAGVEVTKQHLRLTLRGLDKALTIMSSIEVPLSHVRGAELAPAEVRGVHGPSFAGPYLRGAVTEGNVLDEEWLFFDVSDAEKAVKITLDHERYAAVVVQVSDPALTIRTILKAIAQRH